MNGGQPTEGFSKELFTVLKEVEKTVHESRSKAEMDGKTLKDLRRIFDQESSRMNRAILNDHSSDEIYTETLRTVGTLIEILAITGKKDSSGK